MLRIKKTQRIKSSLLLTAVAALVLLSVPASVFAKTASSSGRSATPVGSIAVSPGQLNFTLASEGSSQTIPVILHNSYAKDVLLTAALQGIDENGGRLIPAEGLDSVFASSLAVSETEFTIPANGSYQIQVQSTAITSLSPGGHYATLVLTQQSDGGKSAKQAYRAAVSLSIFVIKTLGVKQNLQVSGLQASHWLFALPSTASVAFTNRGNVHVVPHAAVLVTTADGRTVIEKGVINPTSLPLLPGKSLNLSGPLSKLVSIWKPQHLTLRLDYLAEGDAGPKSMTQSFWYIPVAYPIALVVLSLLIWRYRKRLARQALARYARWIGNTRVWKKIQRFAKAIKLPKRSNTTAITEVTTIPKRVMDVTPQPAKKKRKTTKKIIISDDSEA